MDGFLDRTWKFAFIRLIVAVVTRLFSLLELDCRARQHTCSAGLDRTIYIYEGPGVMNVRLIYPYPFPYGPQPRSFTQLVSAHRA